jgi:hypothetical protein
MSLAERPPSAGRTEYRRWAERLNDFLTRTKSKLATLVSGDNASENGTLLWDRDGYPVVAKEGEWRQVVLSNGFGSFTAGPTINVNFPNTELAVPWSRAVSTRGGISLDPTDNTKIKISEAGVYNFAGHAQITSNSTTDKTVWLWYQVNNTDDKYARQYTIHDNNRPKIIPLNEQIELPSDCYVQLRFAASATNVYLDLSPAGTFHPVSEAVYITVTRVLQ